MSAIKDRYFVLAKRYREIVKLVTEADFKLCEWARDLQRETANDDTFIRWCGDELGLTDGEARFDLLPRAAAFAVAPDAKTWSEIGGYRTTRKLARLPRKEQVECINVMKASGYGVDKVMRDRGHGPKPIEIPKGSTVPPSSADTMKLAKFIAETLRVVPVDIRRIVDRYVRQGADAS